MYVFVYTRMGVPGALKMVGCSIGRPASGAPTDTDATTGAGKVKLGRTGMASGPGEGGLEVGGASMSTP